MTRFILYLYLKAGNYSLNKFIISTRFFFVNLYIEVTLFYWNFIEFCSHFIHKELKVSNSLLWKSDYYQKKKLKYFKFVSEVTKQIFSLKEYRHKWTLHRYGNNCWEKYYKILFYHRFLNIVLKQKFQNFYAYTFKYILQFLKL